ncbi:type IV secretion system protein VirB4 [Leuconostoc pseudomesenteroides]|uniref:type IV secretion system protein VirB4 n=1 Tax=Leuconostoc pseudomesenteroides TaxID=33968 RepID=UPI0039E79100
MRTSPNAKMQAALKARGYDLSLLAETQNIGGTEFHTQYISWELNKVSAIVSVYDFPKTAQGRGWLRNLMNQEDAIIDVKIGTEDRLTVEKALETAHNNLQHKANSDMTNEGEAIEASADAQVTLNDLNQARNGHEVYKRVYIRIMLNDSSLEHLRERISKVQRDFNDFKLKVYNSEQLNHWQQFFKPAMKVENLSIRDKGFPMKAYALAMGYWFNQTFISHPFGAYMGLTFQDGEIMFDPAYYDGKNQLTAYNLVIGGMRYGKSSFVKKVAMSLWAKGDDLWVFDKSGEYQSYVDFMGGLSITMDGSENRVNLFQVYGTVLDNNGEIDVIRSFSQHRSKIVTWYSTLNPQAGQKEREMLLDLINDFYIEQRMWSLNPKEHPEQLRVIGLANDDYPIMEDFITFLQTQQLNTRGWSSSRVQLLENILSTFNTLNQTYGDMVNGGTTVPDLASEQIVRFDTSGLSKLDNNLYNAQYFTILSLMESYVVQNGIHQRQRMKTGEIKSNGWSTKNPVRPHYFWWLQDEADDIFNAKNPLGMTFGDNMMAQHGKDFFGIFAIFPSLKNVVPTGNVVDSELSRANRSFFGRFNKLEITHLPQTEADLLGQVVPEEVITPTQRKQLSSNGMQRGDMLIALIGDQSVFGHIELTDWEINLFGGGL